MFKSRFILLTIATLTIACLSATALAQPTAEPAKPSTADSAAAAPTLHPALFLVGDSIMKTGMGNGERGPWGWGSEISALFDAGKIHVYNEGHGGRTGRSFIAEGLWADVLKRIEPGDFVMIQFGHNEAANSQNFPDRISAKGNGDETQEISAPKTGEKENIHTYGWYLRQLVADAKAKGATVIICSPVPRNTWIDGKIKRGFDGYAEWAADAAKQSDAQFIDLNTLAANGYDALGQQKAASYFNDNQHTTKPGARLNAEAVVEGLKQLKDCPLASILAASPPETAAPVTESPTKPAAGEPQSEAKAAPSESKTDLPSLYVLGDSTAANNSRTPTTVQGWGTPFQAYFDPAKIHVVNAARGGRSARRTYITEGLLDAVVAKLKPGDTVLVQFGHNDAYDINETTGRGSLHGIGEETEEIDNKLTKKHEVVHTFGWYLRKFVNDIRSQGAQPIILTLTIRDRWNKDGTIERLPVDNLDLTNTNRFHEPSIYSNWSAEVAKDGKAPLLDIHNLIADRYEKDGKDVVSTYFNNPGDPTHRNARGAEVDAELTLAALKAFKGHALDAYLSEKGIAVPAADNKYVFANDAAADSPPANTATAKAPSDKSPEKTPTAPAAAVEPVPQAVLDKVYDEVKTPFKYGVVIPREGDEWIDCPSVFRFHNHWYMMYVRFTPKVGYETMLAQSDDLLHWEKLGPILSFRKEGWDAWQADAGISLVDPTWGGSSAPEQFDGKYWCSYIGGNLKGMEPDPLSTGIAWSTTPDKAVEWNRIEGNPVLSGSDADARPWEKTTLFKTTILRDPQQRFGEPFLMYYNGRTKPSLESIGMAISKDMIHWKRFGPQEPLVIDPENGKGTGISGDPQLVKMQIDGKDIWVMFYFGFRWAGPGAFDTFAASNDLLHWTKWRGPHLIQPSAKDESTTFDNTFAHKPWVIKHDGVVYHFYCCVGKGEGRQIAVATSKDMKGQGPSAN